MPWKNKEPMDQRMEFAVKSLRTNNFRALCREYQISAKTGYKWQKRLLAAGLPGLAEHSRRPLGHADQLKEAEVCEIVRLKQAHRHWGPRKLREVYVRLHGRAASESSFKRVLSRSGLTEPRRRRRLQFPGGRLNDGRRAQGPNDIWTVDFKGWWYDPQGRRCEPLTVRDEHSRYLLELRRLPNSRTATVRECFEGLFERYGLPGAIRSDNVVPFAHVHGLLGLSKLSAWWVALGIDLERGRPGHPQDNGAHERMHRDMSRELQPQRAGQAALDVWRQEFNEQRPHEALAMKVPADIYKVSERKYKGPVVDLEYAGMGQRRVSQLGTIKWGGAAIFLTTSLTGWSVGLKAVVGGDFEVWFGRLFLGWLEPATQSFRRAEDRPAEALATQPEV